MLITSSCQISQRQISVNRTNYHDNRLCGSKSGSSDNSLHCCHGDVDDGDVVDGPADVLGLVEQSLRVPDVHTDLDSPEEEQQLAWGKTY